MSDNKFKGTYRIPSARAQWHNYEGGEYFVTICTQNREHFFGEIVNGEMRLSEVGKCLMEQIEKTSQMRPDMNIDIPLFVIMPNHVHLVIFIGNNEYNAVPVHRSSYVCKKKQTRKRKRALKFVSLKVKGKTNK